MKKKYPDYRGEEIDADSLYKKLSDDDKRIVEDFMRLGCNSSGILKKQDIRRSILQFLDILEKPIYSINLRDLQEYLVMLKESGKQRWTIIGIKAHTKRFLRFKFREWSERFNNFIDYNQIRMPIKQLDPETLPTDKELEMLLRTCKTLRDKAMLTMIIELGCRPQELRDLRWRDIKYRDDGIADVHLYSSKTKRGRKFPIKESVVHLKRWEQEYCFPNKTNSDLLFPSPFNRDKPISRGTLSMWLNRLSKRAGITKKIFPYLMRHKKATELYTKIGDVASKALGHSPKMKDVYLHNSDDEVGQALLSKVYHVEELTPQEKSKVKELEYKINVMQNKMDFWNRIFSLSANNKISVTKDGVVVDNMKKGKKHFTATFREVRNKSV